MLTFPIVGTGFTITVKVFVALNGGAPSSVTTVVRMLVVPACAKVGVQVMMPVFGSMVGPVNVLDRTYASVFVGTSVSVAVLVTTSVASGLMMRVACGGSTGGVFVACTTPTKISR